MDLNKQISDMMKSLGLNADIVDQVMAEQNVDFNALAAEAEAEDSPDTEENPALKELMQNMGRFAEQIGIQGGIMPDDLESMAEQFSGMGGLGKLAGLGSMDDMLSKVGDLFGGTEYDEIDLDEEVAAYDPAAEDAADRKFLAALKEWIKATLNEIPADDVCMLEIGYHVDFTDETLETPVYNVWLAYNTEETKAANAEKYGEEIWNWINWTDDEFRTLPDEPFAAWRQAQGYDEDNDGDDMTERIYDLAVVAVMELHREKFTEQRFGKKVPFVIEDYEYYQKTAIRAVKANGGTELFDQTFFRDCGFDTEE